MFVNRLFHIGIFFLLSFITNAQVLSEINYQESDENFPNPGRGFYHAVENVDYDNMLSYREEGISLIFKTYKLDDFKTGQISLCFLNNMKADFASVRKAGLKMIIRFSYTEKTSPPYGDAPLLTVIGHIQQLKPVLRENSDVILVLQAGFIGAWGEWYYTDYFSQSPGVITEENWNDRRELTDSLLEMMPDDRMVQVRTPNYKRHLLQMEDYIPVGIEQAYTDAYIARIAHHNDCFVSSNNDVGTYLDTLVEKPYLAEDSKYTIVGGETCSQCSYSHCENAVRELKRFHWTFLNRDYHLGVIGDWIDEGCYDDILLKLGYRYRLINATYQEESRPGGTFYLNIKLWNDGWANPSNPLDVKVVLRNTADNSEYSVKAVKDIRFSPFEDTINIAINAGLPVTIAEGDYDVFLQLTDSDPLLADRPEYSIHLANQNVWDEENGYNNLLYSVSVTTNGGDLYYGCNFFQAQNIIPIISEIIIDGNPEDWESLPVLCRAQNQDAQELKASNNEDSLNFLITGENMVQEFRFFINSDNDTTTGFTSGEWPGTGSDYMIENNNLMKFTGNNGQFEWEFIQNVNIAQNDTVIEVSVPTGAFQNGLARIYGLGVVVNYQSNEQQSIFPQLPAQVLLVNKNAISGAPEFVKSKNLGTTNVIYWTKNPDCENTIVNLQRSDSPGAGFETIYKCRNRIISFSDKGLNENQSYYYRLQYKVGKQLSPFSDTIEQSTENSVVNHFVLIKLDGQAQDWKICPPVATGIIGGEMTALRFFNDSDSLFFSVESYTGVSFSLYYNVDGVPGFDFVLRNDTLYSIEENNYIFIKIIPSFQGDGFLECGFLLSDIQMDSADMFYSRLVIDGQQLWDKEEGFGYMKYEVLPAPSGYGLEPSVSDPYTRIKIKWAYNSNPSGYIIERSVGDSLHFEKLTELPGNKFYYLDNDLDSSLVYYYRMYSFNDLIRSQYTEIKWMKPGSPQGVGNHRLNSGSVIVKPNPVRTSAKIEIQLDSPDDISVALYNIKGEKLCSLFSGKVVKQKVLTLRCDEIPGGLYMLKVSGNHTLIRKKVIFY